MLVQVKSFDIQKERLEKRGMNIDLKLPISLSSRVCITRIWKALSLIFPGWWGDFAEYYRLINIFCLVRKGKEGLWSN
jgi:hypothetical protein